VTRRRSLAAYAGAYLAYQLLALVAWWHLLADGIASSLPTKSGDPGEEVWFLATLPHALSSGSNPFFSHAIFAPQGVNLLANTSMDLLGLVFSPVTVLAGPIATFSVASLLAPATSALGAFALCRRHVSFTPAAWVGGLVYGFGPFLATDLRFGHLDLTWLVFPPLIFLALERLLEPEAEARHRLARGAVVGALVVMQFFVSTELLAITVIMVMVALVLWLVVARGRAVRRLGDAAAGLALALAVPAVALAYPIWFAVAGPRHISGAVWPHIDRLSASLAAAVLLHGELAGVRFISEGNGSYLGIGLLAVLVLGAIRFWDDTRLRAALAMAAAAYVASLGYSLHAGTTDLRVPLPAAVLGHLPLVNSIIPERFAAMVDLFAGLSLAAICDGVRKEGLVRARAASSGRRGARTGVPAVVAVAAVALVPLVFEPSWPYPAEPLALPAVLRAGAGSAGGPAGTAPDHSPSAGRLTGLVEVFPTTPQAVSGEMVAQAEEGFGYELGTGYAIVPGPRGHGTQQPPLTAVTLVFAAASLDRLTLPLPGSTRAAFEETVVAERFREIVVLPHATGSATVDDAMSEMYGHPSWSTGGAQVWVFPRH
jgi:hypothetical protein